MTLECGRVVWRYLCCSTECGGVVILFVGWLRGDNVWAYWRVFFMSFSDDCVCGGIRQW